MVDGSGEDQESVVSSKVKSSSRTEWRAFPPLKWVGYWKGRCYYFGGVAMAFELLLNAPAPREQRKFGEIVKTLAGSGL
jgi:hypothetical protein